METASLSEFAAKLGISDERCEEIIESVASSLEFYSKIKNIHPVSESLLDDCRSDEEARLFCVAMKWMIVAGGATEEMVDQMIAIMAFRAAEIAASRSRAIHDSMPNPFRAAQPPSSLEFADLLDSISSLNAKLYGLYDQKKKAMTELDFEQFMELDAGALDFHTDQIARIVEALDRLRNGDEADSEPSEADTFKKRLPAK